LTLAAAVFGLGLAPGCIHVHTDADGNLKSIELKGSGDGGKAAAPADPEVKPAAATVPAAPAAGAAAGGLAKYVPKLGGSGGPQAANIAITWRPKLEQLPDPARNGAMGTGIVGQMFLLGPDYKFIQADGKLVVELFDETARPGATQPVRLGEWTINKDWLRRLVAHDERFGKCYVLFLPWPSYRPDIARVKLTARFEPESGYPLYVTPQTMTIDTSTGGDGSPISRSWQTPNPGAFPAGPAGAFPTGPQPSPGAFPAGLPAAASAFPAAIPIPPPTPAGTGGLVAPAGPAAPLAPAGPAAGAGLPPGMPSVIQIAAPPH
jgi:hypothetical protein